jgi:hypothetical protein
MAKTWIDFCRERDMNQDSIPFEHQDWFAWMDYAAKQYQEPLPAVTGMDWSEGKS